MVDLLVADLDWLTPQVAVGGDLHPDPELAAAQARWLEEHGVTDILDCREEHSDAELVAQAAPSLRYHHLPVDDHGGRMPAHWWRRGVQLAGRAIEQGGSVFVHCHMGINRGPSMALAILIDQGWEPIEAWRLLRARRPYAFAVYGTQYLLLVGRDDDAQALADVIDEECDRTDRIATIGRIRRAEGGTGYRFPLAM